MFNDFARIGIEATAAANQLDRLEQQLGRTVKQLEAFGDALEGMAGGMNLMSGFKEVSDVIDIAGTSLETAKDQADGLGRGFEVLSGVLGVVRTGFDGLKTADSMFKDLMTKLEGFSDNLDFLSTVLDKGNIISNFNSLKTTIAGLGSKLKVFLGPKGWILLLVGALITLIATNEDVQEKLKKVWEAIKTFLEPIIEGIKDVIESVFAGIQDFIYKHGDSILETIKLAWEFITTLIETAIEVIRNVIEVVFAGIQAFLDKHGDSILEIIKLAWEFITTLIETAIKVIQNVIEAVFGGIQDFMDKHGDAILETIKLAWDFITEFIEAALNGIWLILGPALDLIKNVWEATWDNVKGVFSAIWGTISSVFSATLDVIKGIFNVFIGVFTGDWERAWEGVKDIGRGLMDGIVAIFSGIKDIGRNLIEGLWEGIRAKATWLQERVSGFFDDMLGGVKRFLRINSPSGVFRDQIGAMIAEGTAEGIDKESYQAEEAAAKMAHKIIKHAKICMSEAVLPALSVVSENGLSEQIEMFSDGFAEIRRIILAVLKDTSAKALKIIRKMTALIDSQLRLDGRQAGRNFFLALGEGLIDVEARLLAEALRVADALREIFWQRQWEQEQAFGLNSFASDSWQASSGALALDAGRGANTINQYFYGVREQQTAYQTYRAAQKALWEGDA